jgi:hypothetical protein
MIIVVRKDQTLALEEEEDFKNFCIRVKDADTNIAGLDMITRRIEDGNYWLDAQDVIALSSKSVEKQWLDQFWAMLKGAEPYGYADIEAQLIRAHIEYEMSDEKRRVDPE